MGVFSDTLLGSPPATQASPVTRPLPVDQDAFRGGTTRPPLI